MGFLQNPGASLPNPVANLPSAGGYGGQVNDSIIKNPVNTVTPGGNSSVLAGWDANGKWNPGSALGGVQGAGGSVVSGWHGILGDANDQIKDWSGKMGKGFKGLGGGGGGGPGGGGGGPGGAGGDPSMPQMPGYGSLLSGGAGSKTLLGGDLKLQTPGAVTPDKVSFGRAGNALTDLATQQGPSPWLQQSLANQSQLKNQALSQNAAGAMGSQAAQEANLATHGGLSSGASERLAANTARSTNAGAQGIQTSDINQRNLLGIQDEATKTGLLSQAAGLETGINEFNSGQGVQTGEFNAGMQQGTGEYNINNALGETAGQRGRDMDKYKTDMTTWSANNAADAILKAAPGSGGGMSPWLSQIFGGGK